MNKKLLVLLSLVSVNLFVNSSYLFSMDGAPAVSAAIWDYLTRPTRGDFEIRSAQRAPKKLIEAMLVLRSGRLSEERAERINRLIIDNIRSGEYDVEILSSYIFGYTVLYIAVNFMNPGIVEAIIMRIEALGRGADLGRMALLHRLLNRLCVELAKPAILLEIESSIVPLSDNLFLFNLRNCKQIFDLLVGHGANVCVLKDGMSVIDRMVYISRVISSLVAHPEMNNLFNYKRESLERVVTPDMMSLAIVEEAVEPVVTAGILRGGFEREICRVFKIWLDLALCAARSGNDDELNALCNLLRLRFNGEIEVEDLIVALNDRRHIEDDAAAAGAAAAAEDGYDGDGDEE